MGLAGYITILIVVVYLGFELFGLHKARNRMEPGYVFNEFVGARRAVALCPDEARETADFERNFKAVTERAISALAESSPDSTIELITSQVNSQRKTRESEVAALVAAEGCDSKTVWRLLKLYEIRSTLNLR